MHIKLKCFRSSIHPAGKNDHFFFKFYLFWRFSHFLQTSKVYGIVTMGSKFLGVQILIIWVVFAVKTVTLLWQLAKAQDIASVTPIQLFAAAINLLYSH